MATTPPPSPEELILSMLRDVLARQAAHMGLTTDITTATPIESTPAQPPALESPNAPPSAAPDEAPPPAPEPIRLAESPKKALLPEPPAPVMPFANEYDDTGEPLSAAEQKELEEFDEAAAQPFFPGQMPHTVRWLVGGLVVLLILINIPFPNGAALARALPDRQALVIRDGLLLKGSGPEVYVIENNTKRWVSSLDAFEHYGYVWVDVHQVDDAFLRQFPDGRPLHVLLKCNTSPHIYRLENNLKRWIKDIPTFEAEGHVWEDVRFVSCGYLRSIPDGPPIPPDAGPPPVP